MEEFFGVLESDYLRLAASVSRQEISFLDQISLIKYCALQMMRSPVTRDLLNLIAMGIFPEDPHTLSLLGVDQIGIDILHLARTGDRMAQSELSLRLSEGFLAHSSKMLEQLNFKFLFLRNAPDLVTSDNPALLISCLPLGRSKWKVDVNLPNRRTIFAFPLTPKILLFGDSKEKAYHKTFNFDFFEIANANAIVKNLNGMLFDFSRHQIYSGSCLELDRVRNNSIQITKETPLFEDRTALSFERLIKAVYCQAKHLSTRPLTPS